MKKALLVIVCLYTHFCFAQPNHGHAMGRAIRFPNIPGYQTLKCDLHQHTVFSDGSVWPDIRVMEALMDSLDVISLTEHLEYQPHKADIPHPDRNRSYEIAVKEAKDHNLVIVRGSEITRRMPPGHCNAIFIQDANSLLVPDSIEVFRAAKKQGAFVFWNHPNWTSQRKDGMATLTDMHRLLIKENLLHGIEVINDRNYSDEALQIALDNNLTIMGTSDIHKLIDWDHGVPQGGHRPFTLVFAKDRTQEAIKDALMNRRTVACIKNLLVGRDEFLIPVIESSLQIKKAKYDGQTMVLYVDIENLSGIDYTLQNKSGYTFHNYADIVTIKAGETFTLQVKTVQKLAGVNLKFEVLSAVHSPNSHPTVTLKGAISQ